MSRQSARVLANWLLALAKTDANIPPPVVAVVAEAASDALSDEIPTDIPPDAPGVILILILLRIVYESVVMIMP
jgi:hypothetical protein